MKSVLSFFALCVLAACASAPSNQPPVALEITLTDQGNGFYQADFRLDEPHEALVFKQAPLSYRAGNWESLTPGASVEKIGQIDVLVFEEPATEASFRFEANGEDLPKAYTSFLLFSEGSHGILTGQFRLAETDGLASVEAFEGNADEWDVPLMSSRLTIKSERPIYHTGQKYTDQLTTDPVFDGTYAFVGDLPPAEGDSFVGFVDPGLPGWIADGFDDQLTDIFARLTDRWGFQLPTKSTLFLAFKGYEREGLHLTGGAIGDLISAEIDGDALKQEIPEISAYLYWFFSHEAAHLYQIANGTAPSDPTSAWIHEGAANAMSHSLAYEVADDPDGFITETLGAAYTGCVDFLEEASLPEAAGRGQFSVYYDCGEFAAMLTDTALPDHDLYDFWNAYVANGNQNPDEDASARYLRTLKELGANPAITQDIARLTGERIEEPRLFLLAAMARAGLPIAFDDERQPTAFTLKAPGDRATLYR